MEKYDYRKELIEDIIFYIKDNNVLDYEYDSEEDLIETLYDELICTDNVTGGGYNYYGTEQKCSEYISNNFDLLYEAFGDRGYFDNEINFIISHYEDKSLARYFDYVIREHLLYDCISEALEKLGVKV